MPRSYRNISMYEKEILRLREAGFTEREICEKLGFSKSNMEIPYSINRKYYIWIH